MKLVYSITLPKAKDPVGRWFEDHGAEVSLTCILGKWHARLEWRKVHSYNDDAGSHIEQWAVSRDHEDPNEAIRLVWEAAQEVAAKAAEELKR